MNWDRVQGNWKEFKGKVQQKWGKLTDEDLERIDGKAERLADALQDKYGYTRQNAESQSNRWMQDHQAVPAAQA